MKATRKMWWYWAAGMMLLALWCNAEILRGNLGPEDLIFTIPLLEP